jgi:hypothetical protein
MTHNDDRPTPQQRLKEPLMTKQTPDTAARTAFLTATVTAYRARAAQAGIQEVSEDVWAQRMQARMAALYGPLDATVQARSTVPSKA